MADPFGFTLAATVAGEVIPRVLDSLFGGDEEREYQRIRRTVTAREEGARYIIGRSKIAGALVYHNQTELMPGDAVNDGLGRGGVAANHGFRDEFAVVLGQNRLSSISRVWIDGHEFPATIANGRAAYAGNAFQARIDELSAQLTTLGLFHPRGRHEVRVLMHNISAWRGTPLALDIANELLSLYLSEAQRWTESVTRQASLLPDYPTVNVWFDLGGPGVSAADTQAEVRGAHWDGTENQLRGLPWAWVEVYNWSGNTRFTELPNVQVLADSSWGSNPATIISRYLDEICGVQSTSLLGLSDAERVCDEDVLIRAVARGDGNDPDKLVTNVHLLPVLFPQHDWTETPDGASVTAPGVSTADQDKALTVWNTRYSGLFGQQKRYSAHGVITADMIRRPIRMLRALSSAMGGWTTPDGDKYRLIPGAASAPVLTVTEADIVDGFVQWSLSRGEEDRISGIRASLAQDAENDYDPAVMGEVVRTDLNVDGTGYKVRDVGILPFQTRELTARRLMALELRRSAPGLRRGTCTLRRGAGWAHWRLKAGHRIRMNLDFEGFDDTVLLESVVPDANNGTVAIGFRHDPDSIYSDRLDILPVGLVGTKFTGITPPQPPETDGEGLAEVRFSVDDNRPNPVFRIVYPAGIVAIRLEVPIAPDPLTDGYKPTEGGSFGRPPVPDPDPPATTGVRTIFAGLDANGGEVTHTVGIDRLDDGTIELALMQGQRRGEYRVFGLR